MKTEGKVKLILEEIAEDIHNGGIYFVEVLDSVCFISSSKEGNLAVGLRHGEVVALKYYIK